MRIDLRGLPPGVPPACSTARTTSGLHRRPEYQHGNAHRAAGGTRGLPESGHDGAMACHAILRHPCREYGRMCSAWCIPRLFPSKSVGQTYLRTARMRWKEQRAEEVDRLFCIRAGSLKRNLQRSGIGPTLATFGAEHTTSETPCARRDHNPPSNLPDP